MAFLAAESSLASSALLSPHSLAWVTAARGIVVAAVLAYFWRSYVELAHTRLHTFDVLIAVGLGLAVFLAWITFDVGWAALGAPRRGFVPLGADGRLDGPLVALRLLALALVVPVMEELFWRSLVMRWVDTREFLAADPRRASFLAFMLSSALFAAEHSLWFAGFVAGLAYGWLYLRSGNLWIPVLSHVVTNATLGVWILATGSWRLW